MALDDLSTDFMPFTRKQGEDLVKKDSVSISSGSDTTVQAFIRASGGLKVSLKAEDISSSSLVANCSCSSAKKGKLCKHIWGSLLVLESSDSDFLIYKTAVELAAPAPESEAQVAAKARKAEYQKQAKAYQKARREKLKNEKKSASLLSAPSYPQDVETAINYFSENGFDFSDPIEFKELSAARNSLAHIFHPDKGGTHEEFLNLNNKFESLAAYIQS